MKDRELFQETFSHLHASADTMMEVKKRMNPKEKRSRAWLTKRAVTLALAAALLLALGVTAYATDLFGMNIRPATEEELEIGAYPVWDEEGNVDYEAGPQLPADGLTFTWDGDTPVYRVEFRPGWLPQFPNHAWDITGVAEVAWRAENWYCNLSHDMGKGGYGDLGICYQISLCYAEPGKRMTLFGEFQTVETETWDDLSVTKVEMYNENRGPENYVLLFSESQGYMVIVGGSYDLETLEHIARELEIRQTDQLFVPSGADQGLLNIGRG
jgi:hypothetical protein